MTTKIEIENLGCLCSTVVSKQRIAYVLYPMDTLSEWLESAARKYGVTIVVVTGMDWQNVFSPWPSPGVPKGTPDFKGQAPEFLNLLQHKVLPRVETTLGMDENNDRSLVGVSMSGLFALWQWMVCDTFRSIASLSGSFWYEGFVEWMEKIEIPHKSGLGFFLLGDKETQSATKAFNTVGANTARIIHLLHEAGITTEFQSVPGNHFADPIPRLTRAFNALYPQTTPTT